MKVELLVNIEVKGILCKRYLNRCSVAKTSFLELKQRSAYIHDIPSACSNVRGRIKLRDLRRQLFQADSHVRSCCEMLLGKSTFWSLKESLLKLV